MAILQQFNLTGYDTQNPVVTDLYYSGNSNISFQSSSSPPTNAIMISLNRSLPYLLKSSTVKYSSNEIQLIGDDLFTPNIYVIVDSDNASIGSGIIAMSYINTNVDTTQFSTYNIKTASVAWQDIQNGNGALVYLSLENTNPFVSIPNEAIAKFTVQNIYLAYFNGIKSNGYLEPVYVFSGTALLSNGNIAQFAFLDSAIYN